MARPSAKVIEQVSTDNTVCEILAAPAYYIITYRGQPVNIRTFSQLTLNQPPKYKKTGYVNLGNCQQAVRRFNQLFNTLDFSYLCIGDFNETTLG